MAWIAWLATAVAVIAAVLNILRMRACFYLWAAANAFWTGYNLSQGLTAQAALFAVYLVISLWGIWSWRDEEKDRADSREPALSMLKCMFQFPLHRDQKLNITARMGQSSAKGGRSKTPVS